MKIFPSLLVQADANGMPLGGFRLWFVAKDYFKEKAYISGDDLKVYLKSLHIPKSTYSRHIRQAYKSGLFLPAGKGLIKLASWKNGAILAGCERLDNPVQVELEKFISTGWQSIIWAAYLKNHDGVLSRAVLRELSGVPERTQRHRERAAGVENQENYAIIGKVNNIPDQAIALYGAPGHYQKDGEIRRRLPNSRIIPDDHVQSTPKGRTKKVNKALDESFSCEATRSSSPVYRLYSDSAKQTKRLQKADRKSNDSNRPANIFERLFVRSSYTSDKRIGVYCAIAL